MSSPEPAARRIVRVRVNPIRCTAFGFCAEFAPELFALDDWGYAWLRDPQATGALAQVAREAARLCPTDAIVIEEVEESPDTLVVARASLGGNR